MDLFDSMNLYESLDAVIGSDPFDLVKQLKSYRTPIKIVAIVPQGTRHVAYIMGDVRKPVPMKQKKLKLQGV